MHGQHSTEGVGLAVTIRVTSRRVMGGTVRGGSE